MEGLAFGFLSGVGALCATGAVVLVQQFGYANVLDWIALRIHQHARRTRSRQQVQTAKVNEEWVRAMEAL